MPTLHLLCRQATKAWGGLAQLVLNSTMQSVRHFCMPYLINSLCGSKQTLRIPFHVWVKRGPHRGRDLSSCTQPSMAVAGPGPGLQVSCQVWSQDCGLPVRLTGSSSLLYRGWGFSYLPIIYTCVSVGRNCSYGPQEVTLGSDPKFPTDCS